MMKKVKFVLVAAVMVIALVANFSVSNNAQSYDVDLDGLKSAQAQGDEPDGDCCGIWHEASQWCYLTSGNGDCCTWGC